MHPLWRRRTSNPEAARRSRDGAVCGRSGGCAVQAAPANAREFLGCEDWRGIRYARSARPRTAERIAAPEENQDDPCTAIIENSDFLLGCKPLPPGLLRGRRRAEERID